MCWLLGRSERTVQVQLKRLRKLNVIEIVGDSRGGRRRTTEYRLIEDKLPKRLPWKDHSPNSRRRAQKGAVTAGFCRSQKGAVNDGTADEKGAVEDTKGCSLRQERVQPTAPDPLVEPSRTVSGFGGGRESDHRFSHNPTQSMTIPTHPQKIEKQMQTAKQVLLGKGHDREVVEGELLRVADLARAAGQTPQSTAYFVKAVENNFAQGQFSFPGATSATPATAPRQTTQERKREPTVEAFERVFRAAGAPFDPFDLCHALGAPPTGYEWDGDDGYGLTCTACRRSLPNSRAAMSDHRRAGCRGARPPGATG